MLSRRNSAPSEAHPPDLICTLTITLSKIAQAAALLSHDMVWKSGPNAAGLPAAHMVNPGVVKPQPEVCVIKTQYAGESC
jgi:hypothetical protein